MIICFRIERAKFGNCICKGVKRCPGLNGRLDNAVQVEPVRVAKEYSYRARDVAGDGGSLLEMHLVF